MKEIEITPDGNCFFRALAFHLFESENKHQILRNVLIDFLLRNSELVKYVLEETPLHYIRRTKLDVQGTWVTDIDIIFSSLCFSLNFNVVLMKNKQQILQKFTPSLITGNVQNLETVWLKNSGNHFNYLC